MCCLWRFHPSISTCTKLLAMTYFKLRARTWSILVKTVEKSKYMTMQHGMWNYRRAVSVAFTLTTWLIRADASTDQRQRTEQNQTLVSRNELEPSLLKDCKVSTNNWSYRPCGCQTGFSACCEMHAHLKPWSELATGLLYASEWRQWMNFCNQ